MTSLGRFPPFSAALRQRAVMLRCMRQETANSGRSGWSKMGGKCSALLAGHLMNNELRCEKGHQGRGHE